MSAAIMHYNTLVHCTAAITALYASDLSSLTAGQNFTLVCEAVVHQGTLGTPRISWLDGNSQSVSTNEELGIYLSALDWNGTHTTSLLTFQPLRVALSQDYVCRIEFAAAELVKTHRYTLQVASKYSLVYSPHNSVHMNDQLFLMSLANNTHIPCLKVSPITLYKPNVCYHINLIKIFLLCSTNHSC